MIPMAAGNDRSVLAGRPFTPVLTSASIMTEPEDPPNDGVEPRKTPGGPYFGRLLIVLFAAIAFCGFMTWLLEKLVGD
jgi:hypothetical protein